MRIKEHISKKIVCLFVIALLLILGSCREETSNQEQTTVKIGHLPAAQGLPLYLALEKGYFEEQGITVEVVSFDSPNLLVQALVAGQIDFGAPSTAAGITAIAEAVNPGQLKIFAVGGSTTEGVDKINDMLIVGINSTLTSIEDLKGKKVGILPSIQWRTIATHIFAQHGLSTETDLLLVELAGSLQVQALASGQVDALLTIEPMGTIGEMKGISRELVHAPVEEFLADPFYGGAGVLRTEFAEQNPETTKKILSVFAQAIDEINANPEEARVYLTKYTPLSEDIANELPFVEFKMYNDFTEEDITALQTFFDIFWEYEVITKQVNVRDIVYSE